MELIDKALGFLGDAWEILTQPGMIFIYLIIALKWITRNR